MKAKLAAFLIPLLLLALGRETFPLDAAPVLRGATALPDAALMPIQEISYYPRNHPWLRFWAEWPQTRVEMETDLDVIRNLGANTVRIFVHPAIIGYPVPYSWFEAAFGEALALIADHSLRAHVTLFDCWSSWTDVEGSRDWLEAIVPGYADDPRIALWELRNEIPLGEPGASTWVQSLFPLLQQRAGNTPATVSVSNVAWLSEIRDLVQPAAPVPDSLHWYPPSLLSWTAPLSGVLGTAQAATGGGELLVGEFGANTYRFSEASQADLYRDVLYQAHRKGIVHLGAWTLYDFPAGTEGCAAGEPVTDTERYFGIYRVDGTAKPARDILREAFHGRFPSSPSPIAVHNTSFEEANPNSGLVDNWMPWDVAWSGEQTFARDCTRAHTGACSVVVTGSVTTPTRGLFAFPGFPVEPGKQYSLEGYVQTEAFTGEVWLAISWFGAGEDEDWLGDTRSSSIQDTDLGTWARLCIDRVEPPPGAAYFRPFAQIDAPDGASRAWLDDVTMLVERVYLPVVSRGQP